MKVKVSWPIVHWVIDKGIPIKMSSTHVLSVTSLVYISNANEQSYIVSRLVTCRNNLY